MLLSRIGVSTDVSKRMIEIANSKLGDRPAGAVSFRQAEASQMVGDEPFDAICAFSLLHLVGDVHEVLDVVYRQLKPGGLFISKTVCLGDGFFGIRLLVRSLTAVGVAPKVVVLKRSQLVRHLKSAGFEIETVTHFGRQKINPFIVARRPLD